MIVRLTEIIRRQLIADTGFGPVQVRGKLGQKCQIRFFSFDDPAGDGQTVDRRESFLTCMRGKENDAAIIFLCGVIIISAGLSIGFTGISAEFQIRSCAHNGDGPCMHPQFWYCRKAVQAAAWHPVEIRSRELQAKPDISLEKKVFCDRRPEYFWKYNVRSCQAWKILSVFQLMHSV